MNQEEEANDFYALFWRPEYLHAWNLCFEINDERSLLIDVLKALPPDLGELEFVMGEDYDRFIVLFTHDYESSRSRRNESVILSILCQAGALKFFGAEGAGDRILSAGNLRDIRDRDALEQVARYMLDRGDLGPIGYALVTSGHELTVVGIEDDALYKKAANALLGKGYKYYDSISERRPRLFDNMISKMAEFEQNLAGMTLTAFNYQGAREILRRLNVGCAGVKSKAAGLRDRVLAEAIRDQLEPHEIHKQIVQRIERDSQQIKKGGITALLRRIGGLTIQPLSSPLAGRTAEYARAFPQDDPYQFTYGIYYMSLLMCEIGRYQVIGERGEGRRKVQIFKASDGYTYSVPVPKLRESERQKLNGEIRENAKKIKELVGEKRLLPWR